MKQIFSFCLMSIFLLNGCGEGDERIQSEEDVGVGSKTTMEEENDLFGISDHKVLYGKVLKKRRDEVTIQSIDDSKDFYETIFVKVDDEKMLRNIRRGKNIVVWYDFIRESNPPQTKALKIEIQE